MIPVQSIAIDSLVPEPNQLIAEVATAVVAIVSVIAVVRFCIKKQIWWPLWVVVSGTMVFLHEPLYDHLMGLWFLDEGQRNAVTTYGIHVPIWLPIVYVAYYGCTPIWYWHKFQQGMTMPKVLTYFTISALLAGLAEIFYINIVGLYTYQDHQPFMVWNYPIFLAIVNGVPPFLAAIILHRLVPILKGWEHVVLLGVLPFSFASNTFGTGILYLAARHLSVTPPMWALSLLALQFAAGTYLTIWIAARLAGIDRTGNLEQN
tara:strand:+ start:724 stop:1506 length:783 start_codon:yes stop_codon:yes gene_type:complete